MKKKTGFGFTALSLAAILSLAAMPEYVPASEGVTETIDVGSFSASTDNVTYTAVTGAAIATVKKDGTYDFTGETDNFSIEVKKGVTATLILDNLTIDNSALAADSEIESSIMCKKESTVILALAGSNKLVQNPDNTVLESGVKHGKESAGSISFTEYSTGGSLTIQNSADDAIKFKGAGGTTGIVNVESGTINIENCYGDGIQAEVVNISGGELNIETAYQNASTQYYTSGSGSVAGKNTIWESGSTKYERVNVDTGSHKGIKAGTKAKTENYLDGTESKVTEASGGLTVNGGTIRIDTTGTGLKANKMASSGYSATSSGVYIIGSPDDAIQSNNSLSISGGTLSLSSSDDGISTANELIITGTPEITIRSAFEGMEGKTITIGTEGASNGPTLNIQSDDDGINAASKTLTYTYDSAEDEDCNYLKESVSSSSGCACTFYSGSVNIQIDSENKKTRTLGSKILSYYAAGDGIDCNGTLDIEGGSHTVFGQSSGDNSPIDTNNGFTLGNQATVLAAGVDGMGEMAPKSGNGVYLYTSSTGSVSAQTAGSGGNAQGGNMQGMPGQGGMQGMPEQGGMPGFPGGGMTGQGTAFSAGSVITIQNGSTTLLSKTLPYSASVLFYAAPELTSGTSYTVTVDGNSTGNSGNTWYPGSEAGNGTGNTGNTGDTGSTGTGGSTSSGTTTGAVGNGSTADNTVISTTDTVKKGSVLYGTDSDNNTVKVKITKNTAKKKTVTYKVEATGTEVTIPDTVTINGTEYKVTVIAAKSCKKNTDLTTVNIGANVTKIGKYAFYGCSNLTTINFDGSKVTSIGTGAFKKIASGATVEITATKKKYKAIKALVKASGAPKKITFVRIAP